MAQILTLTYYLVWTVLCLAYTYIHIIQTDSSYTLSNVKCTHSYVKLLLLCKLHTLFSRRCRRLIMELSNNTIGGTFAALQLTMISKDLLPLGLMILPEKKFIFLQIIAIFRISIIPYIELIVKSRPLCHTLIVQFQSAVRHCRKIKRIQLFLFTTRGSMNMVICLRMHSLDKNASFYLNTI